MKKNRSFSVDAVNELDPIDLMTREEALAELARIAEKWDHTLKNMNDKHKGN